MTTLAILAMIALFAWIVSNIDMSPRARNVVWIVAAILAVLVVANAIAPGIWRS